MLVVEKSLTSLDMEMVLIDMKESRGTTTTSLTSDQQGVMLIAIESPRGPHKKLPVEISHRRTIILGGNTDTTKFSLGLGGVKGLCRLRI